MNKRMKGFTCCGDCIHYSYKKHKCNLGASVTTDARKPFYDDCPIPDITSEQEIRDEAIDTFMIAIETHMKVVGNTYLEDVREIAKRLKESKQMNNRTKYDEPTSKWFEEHTDVQTTVCKCDKCGLFYKPSLGHKCKKGVADER